MGKYELLAPVGTMESLYAAVQNGADAVYLGGKLFNARHYASNFSNEDLEMAVEYAHLRGVKVFVTMNILIDNSEMESALDYIKYLYDIDVDALIVQDLGLAGLVRKLFPDLNIHGSTQMTVNNAQGAKFLYDQGFKRVVLARETPLSEISYIRKNVPIELEVFVHGALCVSYSGQCLMSSMIGGRSGNRGRCAQPCRMPSSLLDRQGRPIEGFSEKHILSPKDLNTVEEIETLMELGVNSFKMEGRMKRPEYVATISRVYRKAIDLGSKNLEARDKKDLKQIFNRGFTRGIGFGDFGRKFISYDRPDNRGLELGQVIRFEGNQAVIILKEDLQAGDGLEFQVGPNRYRGLKVVKSGKKGQEYLFPKIGYVEVGSMTYKTSSLELLDRARLSYEEESIFRPLNMNIEIIQGKKPRLSLESGDYKVQVEGKDLVEPSKKAPLTEERVMEQLGKLGDTIFEIENLTIDLEADSFMSVSSINKLRRDGIQLLNEKLANYNGRDIEKNKSFRDRRDSYLKTKVGDRQNKVDLSIEISSLEQAKALDLDRLSRIYIHQNIGEDIGEILDVLKGFKGEIYFETDRILYGRDFKEIKSILDKIEARIHGVSVSNLGSFQFIKDNYDLKIHGTAGLNIFNSYTLEYLRSLGMDSCDLSIELNLNQINQILRRTDFNIGLLGYGYIPVMIMEHCPMALYKDCDIDADCDRCRFARGYKISDRIAAEFRLIRNRKLTAMYNPVPLMIVDSLEKITFNRPSNIRLNFNFQEEKLGPIQEVFYNYLEGIITREEVDEFIEEFKRDLDITNGHYFRGILDGGD